MLLTQKNRSFGADRGQKRDVLVSAPSQVCFQGHPGPQGPGAGSVGSEPVPGVVAVAARRAAVAMRLVGVLVGVLVVLVGVLLRGGGHAVAALVRPLVVVVLVRRHEVAPLVGGGVVPGVVALPHLLALLTRGNRK